jgi:hypothetical protein
MWYVGDGQSGIEFEEEDSDFYGDVDSGSHSKLHIDVTSTTKHFEKKCKDKERGLALFGTVPPPKNIPLDQVRIPCQERLYWSYHCTYIGQYMYHDLCLSADMMTLYTL